MSVLHEGYKRAYFFGTQNFNFQNIGNMMGSRSTPDGFSIRIARHRCMVHPAPKRNDIIVMETSENKYLGAYQFQLLRKFIEGSGRDVRVAPKRLDTAAALDYLRNFQREIKEFKLHPIYYDLVDIEGEMTVRTKNVYNMRNVDEVAEIGRIVAWDIRGAALTVERKDVTHYGFVFFDANPTARVQTITVSYGVFEDLARELVNRLP